MKPLSKNAKRSLKVRLIRTYTQEIKKLEDEQQKLFKNACEQLDIHPYEEPRSTALYDALFNGWKTPTQIARELWPVQAVAKSSETKAGR